MRSPVYLPPVPPRRRRVSAFRLIIEGLLIGAFFYGLTVTLVIAAALLA